MPNVRLFRKLEFELAFLKKICRKKNENTEETRLTTIIMFAHGRRYDKSLQV